MYQIIFYVPASHVDVVKEAMFVQGAGKMGNYEYCAWQVLGEGQFKPLSGSQPYLGEQGKLEHVPEYKVEIACEKSYLTAVLNAMKASHPYEQPAYFVYEYIL